MQALVIDDDPQVRTFVANVLSLEGWTVSQAETSVRALELLREARWPLVFCDVFLNGPEGFDVLARFVEEQPEAHIVLMTGHGSAAGALDAVSHGAYDYLLKPFGASEVERISGAVRHNVEGHEKVTTAEESNGPVYVSDIELIGRSHAFIRVMKQVGRLAATNLPVLITGESGTGKEVVARAIHQRSPRASGPFVAVNCGALPPELIESELFGHVRGAFTGAERDRAGLFEEADGGTVFLDEVTETSQGFQVKLLRALQEGEVRRVGTNRTVRVDVRVIAASNREVEAEVEAGRFRQDLFYRLNAVSLHLPPLRERREDTLTLAAYFASRIRSEPLRFSREAADLLESYDWPGNIRELENVVMRAAALCDRVVRPEDLPERVRKHFGARPDDEAVPLDLVSAPAEREWLPLAEIEARYVARVLTHTSGNKQAAARILGIDRKTIDRILHRSSSELREQETTSFQEARPN